MIRTPFNIVKKFLKDELKDAKTFTPDGKIKDEFCIWIAITEDKMLNNLESSSIGIAIGIAIGGSVKKYHTNEPCNIIYAEHQFKTKSEIQHFTEADYDRICSMLEMEYKTKILNEKENKIKEDFND